MNGAEILVRTLLKGEVNVCFANPGTSEMHFLAALDKADGMRCIPALFEGVATGAADGYYRIARKPACTLLHLGPGLGNGLSNLHNAKKAASGIVNIVGQHAIRHLAYESPLTSDIEGLARTVSGWVRTTASAATVSEDAASAITAASARPATIATLMLSADAAWSTGSEKIVTGAPASRPAFDAEAVEAVARLIAAEGRSTLILVGNDGLHTDAVAALAAISGKYGCRVMAQCANVSVSRGAGRYPLSRLPYIVDNAVALLKRFKHVILIDSAEPVAFFTYPDKPSKLCGVGTSVHQMTTSGEDSVAAAIALAESLGASAGDIVWPEVPAKAAVTGQLTPETIAAVIARGIPENGIVVDEALTGGRALYPATASSAPHDWLQNTGGSIGFALPAALGAAVAGCGRRVFAISGDGSAAYTFQALWTYAREGLNVTTIILANNSYEILKGEYAKVGAGEPKFRAKELLDIGKPQIDWTRIAGGLGVAASSVSSAEDFDRKLQIAARETGPSLIEVRFDP